MFRPEDRGEREGQATIEGDDFLPTIRNAMVRTVAFACGRASLYRVAQRIFEFLDTETEKFTASSAG